MDSKSIVLTGVTNAQHQAVISVLLPALFSNPDSFATSAEWQMFKPLAAAFALATAPQTALNNPLQFIDWVFSQITAPHPTQGAKQYTDYITKAAQDLATNNQKALVALTNINDAEVALNQANILLINQNIK